MIFRFFNIDDESFVSRINFHHSYKNTKIIKWFLSLGSICKYIEKCIYINVTHYLVFPIFQKKEMDE